IGSIMMPGMLGFPESLNTALLYRHDPAKAAGLMKEAGVQKAGVPLTWAAGTSYGALPLDRLAQKLRGDLAKIGIDLRLQPVQQSIFLTFYRQGKPQTAIGFWFPDYMDPDNWSYFVTGFINKRLHWQNPEAAKLVADAQKTADPQRRAAMYEQYNRALLALPTLLGITLVTFLVSHLLPPDLVLTTLGDRAAQNPGLVEAFRHRWGLDRPIIVQYAVYLSNLLRGDLGTSIATNRPVL